MSRLSPVNQARWARFRHNRRGYWSLWIFLVLFGLSLCSELIANDKPLLVRYDGSWYFPLLKKDVYKRQILMMRLLLSSIERKNHSLSK